jgi:Ca-activated chloride channel family protein
MRVEEGNPVELVAPDTPGSYEIRYVDGQTREAWATASIEVTGIEVTIRAPATAVAGRRFEVFWTGPAARGDFLTIASPNARPHRYHDWASTTAGSPVTLAAPTRPGRYEVRYVIGNGQEILKATTIEVVP